jgi:steroid delta-isomerase-like uncharacterized protein
MVVDETRRTPAMTADSTAKIVREFWHAYEELNFERALTLFDDDIVYEDLGINHTTRGKEATRQMWMRFHEIAEPDGFRAPLHDLLTTDDGRYSIEWSNVVTLRGAWMGHPVAGRTFEIRGASAGQVKNGRIAAHRDYWNVQDAYAQLGIRDVAVRDAR